MIATLLILGKASLLLSATLLAARWLRRAPAAARHRLWTGLFAAILALPLLAVTLPALDIPVPARWMARAPAAPGVTNVEAVRDSITRGGVTQAGNGTLSSASSMQPVFEASAEDTSRHAGPSVLNAALSERALLALFAIWLIGFVIGLGAIGRSQMRVRQLAGAADELDDAAWRLAADAIGARLGLRHAPRLLVSSRVATPMAGGVLRPAIFLPVSARAWSAEQRDVVIAHEAVHLAGHDPLRHLMRRLALALYWFHPLAWMAACEDEVALEQACDEGVLALGTRPSTYARILLDLADRIYPTAALAGALPMVQRLHLEKRLMAILRTDVRPATRRLALIPAVALALLTASVAAARPAHSGLPPGPRSPGPVVSSSMPTPAPAVTRVLAAAAPATAPQSGISRESACWWDAGDGSSFSGSITISGSGRTEVREQVGRRGNDRIIQRTFGDLRVCMLAQDAGSDTDRPGQLIGRAGRVVLEARGGGAVQRLEVSRQGSPVTWQVDGRDRPVDAAVDTWRDRMLALLDTTWEIATLSGQVSSMRGEISSIQGERSSLEGEISSLKGEVSSMQGEASSVNGRESTFNGEISSIRGHLSSLQGAISSEQGAISSLNATRYDANASDRARIDARIKEHQDAIERTQHEIRDYDADGRVARVAAERDAYDARSKVREVEARIAAFDLDRKVALVAQRIKDLDVEGKTRAIERQIDALDADRRTAQLQSRLDGELTRLRAAIAAIR